MMQRKYLRTSDLARAVGAHPNTVRLYEQWGFIAPAERSANGYRLFTETHRAQMILARTALHGTYPGKNIRRSALALVRKTASGDFRTALQSAHKHLAIVQAERAEAETAARILQHWAQSKRAKSKSVPLQIGAAARALGVTIDVLRNCERNGLLRVPRDEHNGYRLYGAAEISRLRVIRMLQAAGYSTMAILRMLLQLDQGKPHNLRAALDTPRPDEDIFSAADRWLSTLAEQETRAQKIITQLKQMARGKFGVNE
jgi:DNA-binding transcriptional MerR regulator